MIKKIVKIKNIGIFRDFNWNSSIPEFKKYNAFYGWNGTGKTTITRLLSIFEKNNLGKIELEDDSVLIIETENGVLKLSKNESIPYLLSNKIRVFNEDFINENLNWSEGKASRILLIGEEQKRQKDEIKRIMKDIDEKDAKLYSKKNEKEKLEKEKEKILEDARDEIINKLREVDDVKPKSGRAKDYINYTVIDVENILMSGETLSIEENEILNLKKAIEEKEVKDIIKEISIDLSWIDNIINNSKEIFDYVLTRETITSLNYLQKIDGRLKEWLRTGYEIHKDKKHPITCEFCKNEISKERLQELGKYFSDELIKLFNKIDETIGATSFDKLPGFPLAKEQFYSEFQDDYLILSDEFNRQLELVREEINKIKNKLIEKKNNPSQKISFDFYIINEAVKSLNNTINEINELIKRNNDKTESFKDKRRESVHKLELAIISKYKHEWTQKVSELNSIKDEIIKLEQEKKQLEIRQRELEQKLKEHHIAAEEFNNLLALFMGRREIVLETTDDGYIIKRNGRVANNLSEGERSAIALIYFLIKLREENFDHSNGIIVIDDPVSSFDSQYLYGAFGFIKENIKKLNPRQVFIFTHNFPFFRLIRNWLQYEEKHCKGSSSFYIIRSKISGNVRYAKIDKIDRLLEKHDSEYTYLFKLIYHRAQNQDDNLEMDYIYPNAIRKFLENYISFKIPLGGVSIHEKFKKLCEDYPEIDAETKNRIESYCQDQSHPLYQDSPTDFDERLLGEMQNICSAIIKLIEKTDCKHHQHLLNEIKK
jgi:wobble nucleotide-excising tRNase